MPQPLIRPKVSTLTNAIIENIFNSLNCMRIGKVNSFNAETLTAEILVQDKIQMNDGTLQDYPMLVDVPCFCLSGVNGGVDIPIQKNDTGLILFNDRNIDKWWSTNSVQTPFVYRAHSMNDAVFLCGVRSLKNLITGYLTNATKIWYNSNSMIMTDGKTTFNKPIQSAYKSSDGTAGVSGTFTNSVTVKDGIIVGGS